MKYFNLRKYPVHKVLIGFSEPIYEDVQNYCQVNNLRFTTFVNEACRFYVRKQRDNQVMLNI